MSVQAKAEVIKSDYQSQLDKLEAVKASVTEKIVLLEELVAQHDADVKASYDTGYEEGKASVVLPDTGTGEKLFTQEDMDRLAETAKAEKAAELQPQIDAAIEAKMQAESEKEQLAIDLAGAQEETAQVKAAFEADQAKDAEAAERIKAIAEEIK